MHQEPQFGSEGNHRYATIIRKISGKINNINLTSLSVGEFLSCSEGDDVLHGSSLWDCTSSADSDSYNVTTYHKLAMASRRGRVISSLEDGLKFNPKLTEAYYNLIFYANKIESHFRDMQVANQFSRNHYCKLNNLFFMIGN